MRKYLVSLHVDDCGKKITAIKEVRAALGIGLTEAKEFVESSQNQSVNLVVNAEQIVGLVMMCRGPCSGGVGQPYFYIGDIQKLPDTPDRRDYSATQPYH